jgi:hypothetical protein
MGICIPLQIFHFSPTKISPCLLVFQTLWSLVFYHFFTLNSDCKICIVPWFPKTSPGRPSVQSHNYLVLRILGSKGNWQWLPQWIPFQNHGKLVWYKYYNMKLVPLWTFPGFCSYDYSSFLKSQLWKPIVKCATCLRCSTSFTFAM